MKNEKNQKISSMGDALKILGYKIKPSSKVGDPLSSSEQIARFEERRRKQAKAKAKEKKDVER